ncbi:hypothetical protein [Microbacterium sp. NPDC055683]
MSDQLVFLEGVQVITPSPSRVEALVQSIDARLRAWGEASLVAAGTVRDRYVVIVYRERPGFGARGRVFDMDELEREFVPHAPDDLAAVICVDLGEPSGPGIAQEWAWERDLVPTGEEVGWHPPLPLSSNDVPTRMDLNGEKVLLTRRVD